MDRTIVVSNISFLYGRNTILKDVDFSINKEKFISIIGPNGSGKTTLMKILSRILKSNDGKIELLGKDITSYSLKDISKIISYVPQYLSTEFEMSVMDFVLLGRTSYTDITGKIRIKDLEIAERFLTLVGMKDFSERNINKLSGGERQKIFIAKALVQETPIILFDEPIAHLDWHNQIEVLDILKDLSLENKIIISVLHDINAVYSYSDFVIMLKHGKILNAGIPREILNRESIKECYGINYENIDKYFKFTKSAKNGNN